MTARLVHTEMALVPGSPEQGGRRSPPAPGIACVFVRRGGRRVAVGGEIVTHHGPYCDSRGVVDRLGPAPAAASPTISAASARRRRP